VNTQTGAWSLVCVQERAKVEAKGYLEQLLAEGARKLLQAAIENEVAEYLDDSYRFCVG